MDKVSTAAICSAFISFTVLPTSAQMMGHTPATPMTAQQFFAARPSQDVQISVRVDHVKRTAVYAELLEQKSETFATPTTRNVELFVQEDTPTVMGSAKDVVPGAVLFVYGIVSKPGHVDVKRLVIDTKYVKIQ